MPGEGVWQLSLTLENTPNSSAGPRAQATRAQGIHKQEAKRGNMLEFNSFGLVNVIEMVSKVSQVSEISMIQVLGDDPG
jgi:hypothetical protein